MVLSLNRRQLIAASLGAALCPLQLKAAPIGPPLYVVERGGARAFIFGGAIPPDRSWLTPAVNSAILQSTTLWQEDLEPPPPFNRELNIELGRRGGGELFDDLDAQTRLRVTRIAETFDFPLDMFQQMRPWAVGAVVASLDYPRHMAAYKSDDVKGTILTMFKDRGLPVRSEATDGDYWIRFYASFPLPAAIQYMLYQIDLAVAPRSLPALERAVAPQRPVRVGRVQPAARFSLSRSLSRAGSKAERGVGAADRYDARRRGLALRVRGHPAHRRPP